MTSEIAKHRGIITVLLLAALVLALYRPVGGYDFIALDDNLYILDNSGVQRGITLQNLLWAMTTLDTTNWHPLTWLSLMVDYELFGLNAGGYHRTNLLLHLINTILLFVVLRQMTGRDLRSAFVAALFAVHPLNIESVAWIAERKNLLSTLFWLLTLWTYVRYTEAPGWRRYGMVLACFALGLMAKPMAVSLPFVLLLLDYWPLGRISPSGWDLDCPGPSRHSPGRLLGLLREKTPFFILALLSVGVTFHAAQAGGAVKTLEVFPLWGRIANALAAYGAYLGKMVWPADLAIFYPYPPEIPLLKAAAVALILVAATLSILVVGRRYHYLAMGWFWYLITLLPVIGIVQVGYQSMANRYAYVPLIGIFILIAWGIPDLLKGAGRFLPAAAVSSVLSLALVTQLTLPHWRDSEAIFAQALRVTRENHIAQIGMGNLWLERGDYGRAEGYYRESLRIKPDYALARNNLGLALMHAGRTKEAVLQYREALRADPAFADAYNNLGVVMAQEGRHRAARAYFIRAMELRPDYTAAQGNFALLMRQIGAGQGDSDRRR